MVSQRKNRTLIRCLQLLSFVCVLGSFASNLLAAEPTLKIPAVMRLIHEADAPAQAAGVVTQVMAKEGDYVQQGDLLAKLDDSEASLAVEAAKIDVEIAKQLAENDVPFRYASKAAEVADAELRRSKESIRQFAKSVSQSQIDVEKLTAEKARLEQERAKQDQLAARLELKLRKNRFHAAEVLYEQRQIRAPIEGLLVEAEVYPGAWLEPGQKAFRLVNVERLNAEAFVDAKQAATLVVGSLVRVGENRGKISFISPEVDPINQQVRLIAEIENSEQTLRPGDRVELIFELATEDRKSSESLPRRSVGR